MAFSRRNRKQPTGESLLTEEVEVTSIPASVLPGGPDAEAWQEAWADLMEAEEGTAEADDAIRRLEALGMRTDTGRVEISA